MRFLLVSFLTGTVLLLAGCSSVSQEGGVFEDKSRSYVAAKSLDHPLSIGIGPGYSQDPLYPIPDKSKIKEGKLLQTTPRVTSALMPLEQGSILLHKSGDFDRVLFAQLYRDTLAPGVNDYLTRREIGFNDKGSLGPEDALAANGLEALLVDGEHVAGAFGHVVVTDWVSAVRFGYEDPGFFRRLFGADRIEHQYAYFISAPDHTQQQSGFEDYVMQLHLAHRTRSAGSDESSQWHVSIAEDDVLGLEIVNFVEDLKREVALASSGTLGDMTVTVQQDGNGLPYLSVSERFPIVWEALLDALPRKSWTISDLDRSKGIVYVDVKDDSTLSDLKLKKFQLNLAEGPQVMILSVELNDEEPAGVVAGRHVLEVIEKTFEKRN